MSFGHWPACKEQWTENRSFCHFGSSLSGNLGIWFYNLGYCVCFKKTVTEAATECAACLATGAGMQSCSLYWCHSKADLLSCPHKAFKLKVQTFKSAHLKCENTFNTHLRSNTLVSAQPPAWTLGSGRCHHHCKHQSFFRELQLQMFCNPFISFFSRLQQLDKHCQATAQQLVELLNKQNQLFKEKHLLTEEVQFLRTQVLCQKKRMSEGNILQL